MSKIIYTAIIGSYDTLKEPLVITPGWEYLCFTDQDISSKNWQIIKVKTESDPVRQARKIKITPPFDYDECLWLDASFQITGNADDFIYKANGWEMMLMKHPHRNNIIDEVQTCIRLKKDNEIVLKKQLNEYLPFPSNNVLPATGIIYRKNTQAVRVHCLLWCAEIFLHSKRDQISFGFAARRSGLNYHLLDENIYDKNNKFFLLHKHNGR